MIKTRIAIVGFGNIGRGVLSAIPQNPDMELAGIFTRRPESVSAQVKNTPIVRLGCSNDFVWKRERIDVAILCGGSKEDLPRQGPFFAQLTNTVDSYDTHAEIPNYFATMDEKAKTEKNVAVICAGWDPGLFSMMRVLFGAILPTSKSYTFWGPGVSQGHSDAVRKVEGVLDARQYTLPIQTALAKVRGGKTPIFTPREMHRRLVYVVLKFGASRQRVRREIVAMPNYFAPYKTEVKFISADEMRASHSQYPHGGFVLASGVTGNGNKEGLEFSCQLESNPEFTGSVLLACARAAFRLQEEGNSGAFTMLDIPLSYFSPLPVELLRERLM